MSSSYRQALRALIFPLARSPWSFGPSEFTERDFLRLLKGLKLLRVLWNLSKKQVNPVRQKWLMFIFPSPP